MLPSRFVNVAQARTRFGDRVDRLAPYLMRADPLADALVETIEKAPARTWTMFADAAAHGIATVADAPETLRAFFAHVEAPPVWVDWETIDRGGEVLLKAGPLGGLVLGARSLVLGYAAPAGNKPLVFSGRLEQQAARRLNETARFVQATCKRGGLRKHADGWQITLKVRLIHAQVRRMLLRSEKWQTDAWAIPANQHDMLGTSLLFSIVVLDGLRRLGVHVPSEDGERYMQLWRYSGWLSGIETDLLPASEIEALRWVDIIRMTQGDPDDDSRRLTKALLDSPLDGCKTRAERRNGARRRAFGTTLCRVLVGDDLADKLGVAKTSWRHMVPFMKRVVSGVELVRRTMPLGMANVPALWAGERYWDRVVEIGLAGATAEFGLPERLAAA